MPVTEKMVGTHRCTSHRTPPRAVTTATRTGCAIRRQRLPRRWRPSSTRRSATPPSSPSTRRWAALPFNKTRPRTRSVLRGPCSPPILVLVLVLVPILVAVLVHVRIRGIVTVIVVPELVVMVGVVTVSYGLMRVDETIASECVVSVNVPDRYRKGAKVGLTSGTSTARSSPGGLRL